MEMSDTEYLRRRVDNLTEMMAGERFHSWAHTAILILILWRVW